jgi:putative DNA primase/helicase
MATVTFYGLRLMEKARPYPNSKQDTVQELQEADQLYLRFWHDSINGRRSFSERLLADYLIETNPMLYHDKSEQLYIWTGSHFDLWTPAKLRKEAIKALGKEGSAAKVKGACSMAMDMVSTPQNRDLNDMPQWVCLKNGMLNLYTLEFKPHSPDFFSTIEINATWHFETDKPNPETLAIIADKIRPVRWIKFLEETIQTAEVIMQVQEFFGYCLTRETKFGKALLLLGPGSDGKSRLIAVLRTLVGHQNCSAVSMSGLDDQFQRAALFGKILNVATEITTDAVQSEFFKAVVTGDSIQASFKHKDSFEFVPYCKLVYASNKMPRVFDNSDGYFRRLLPILFKRQFLENDPSMDPDLEKKLMLEIDGIFLWSIIGLHRLMKENRFTVADETLDFMMKYRRYNNPVMAFVQDCCSIEEAEQQTPLKELYKRYKEYCSDGGFRPANRENFFEELQTAVRKLREDAAIRRYNARTNSGRVDYVVGIYLKVEQE